MLTDDERMKLKKALKDAYDWVEKKSKSNKRTST